MYVITNRSLDELATGLEVFGKTPNQKGPNELRLVDVTRSGSGYKIQVLGDELSKSEVEALKQKFDLDIETDEVWYASLRVACDLYEQATRSSKHILLFVHGYNNDMGDVLKTCESLEKNYGLVVIAFSWPANGGGIFGKTAYLSDKSDARASADALNRTVGKLAFFHEKLTAGTRAKIQEEAQKKHPNNPQAQYALFTKLLEKTCTTSVNLVCHSMGNYLLKYATKPSASPLRQLVFDNIALVAADANNPDHESWVEALPPRRRLYVVINENDHALGWSRRKPGEQQKARLGHYLKNLVARNAYYLNVTQAAWVKSQHSYFKGDAIEKNAKLKALFAAIFQGEPAEDLLRYRNEGNFFELR